jgi:hypothetical protein
MFYNFFFFFFFGYDKTWKNSGQATDDSIIIRGMRILCWVTKATDTHSEYEILIGFPRQQWVHERALMLRFLRKSPVLYPL